MVARDQRAYSDSVGSGEVAGVEPAVAVAADSVSLTTRKVVVPLFLLAVVVSGVEGFGEDVAHRS